MNSELVVEDGAEPIKFCTCAIVIPSVIELAVSRLIPPKSGSGALGGSAAAGGAVWAGAAGGVAALSLAQPARARVLIVIDAITSTLNCALMGFMFLAFQCSSLDGSQLRTPKRLF